MPKKNQNYLNFWHFYYLSFKDAPALFALLITFSDKREVSGKIHTSQRKCPPPSEWVKKMLNYGGSVNISQDLKYLVLNYIYSATNWFV